MKLALAALLGVLFQVTGVLAQDRSAEQFFEKANELLAQGKTAEACQFFEESMRLEPSAGTALNLADCHARMGKKGLAYDEFLLAARLAEEEKWTEVLVEAESRADELEEKFAKILFEVADPVDGLVIRQDDIIVKRESWSLARHLAPGKHSIEVSAPGYKPWSITVTMLEEDLRVGVPALSPSLTEDDVVPQVASSETQEAEVVPTLPANAKVNHAPSWVLFGASGALVVGATITGVVALNHASELDDACGGSDPCLDEGDNQGLKDSADSLALAADILWITGAAAAAAGVTFWIIADRSDRSKDIALTPTGGFGQFGFQASGRF